MAYMSQFDQVDMGIEFPPYEEPPPPYTPPKPSDIPHGEAPPPYEVTPGGENSNETNNNTGGSSLPGGGRGPRPVQGNGGILPAVSRYSYSSVEPPSTLEDSPPGYRTSQLHHLASPQEEHPSLSISRSAREIQAHSEALTPPGVARSMAQSPSEHEYENLRSACMRQFLLQREPSSEAETASPLSTSPNFSPDMDYPLSSAGNSAAPAAMTMSFHSQGAPASQVMVRMHNDNPRSHLVRAGDQMTSSTPAGLGTEPAMSRSLHDQLLNDDHRPWVPSYRTQFIKRSESVEIKCGSSSPRNSFHTEDPTDGALSRSGHGAEDTGDGAVAANAGGSSGSSSPSNDNPSWPKKKRPLAPNVTWNKSCRPFRIRLDSTSPVGGDGEQEGEGAAAAAGKWGSRQEPRATRHSTYGTGCTSSPSPPSVSVHRHSLPPIDLELPDPVDAILGASGTKYYKTGGAGCSGTSTDPSPGDDRLEVGVSPTGSGRVTGSSESSSQSPVEPVVKGKPKPQAATPSTPSPQSPVGQCMVRSGSVASQVSQFSVCSETGEKKRPRPTIAFPRSLRNDAHYPLSPLSSNYAAPMNSTPPVLKPKKQSPTSPLAQASTPSSHSPRQSPPLPQSSVSSENHSSSVSPTESEAVHLPQAAAVNLNEDPHSSGHHVHPTARRIKISYVDVSPEREKSSSSASTPTTSSDSSGGYPKQPTSPLTNDSTMSSLSPLSSDSAGGFDNQNSPSNQLSRAAPPVSPEGPEAERSERATVRKVKKQSQRRRRPQSTPDATAAVAAVEASKTPTSHSPERLRRLSRNVDNSTTFKQYGFIDDPEVINSVRELTLGQNNGSLPPNHNLQRKNSREKSSRENSCEQRDNSSERKRDNSQERQRSRERRGSRGERRERSHERKRDKGSRSHSREKVPRDRPEQGRSGGDTTGRTQGISPLSPEEDTANRVAGLQLDNVLPSTRVEGRKREREQAQAASLERRKKRRSTGERLLVESSQNNNYPVTLTNGHVYPTTTTNTTNTNGQGLTSNGLATDHQNEADLAPTHRARRVKSNRTHENRHSIPLIVHRNR